MEALQHKVQCPAYTRTVAMREVIFTCVICKQTATQMRYPSRLPKYCSDACIAEREKRRNEERVAKQREKRKLERASRG